MQILTEKRVDTIFRDCLFKDDELNDDGTPSAKPVIAEGIKFKVGFHPDRLKSYAEEINALLHELPNEFLTNDQGGGGGWSFLNACNNKDGEQWANLHQVMDQLVMLGIAIDKAEYLLPRDMWDVLPGGMPYFAVKE